MNALTKPAILRTALLLAVILAVTGLAFADRLTGEHAFGLFMAVVGGVLTRSGVAIGTKGQTRPDDA
jgi:hypothetical protein